MCGSGRKYKNCCLPLQMERKRWDPLEDRVREMIEGFAMEDRFSDALSAASSLFGFDPDKADPGERRLFYDWYIHDYPLPREGKSLIRVLEERMASQPEDDDEASRTLSFWASSTFSFLEVLGVTKGTGFTVRDLFRRSEYFVWDVAGSCLVSKYDIVYCRPYSVGRIIRIASGSIDLPQRSKSQVEEYVKAAYRGFQGGGGKTMDDYLRGQSLQIIRYIWNLSAKAPTLLTSEGDIILFSSCEYTISDPESAIDLLDSCEELVDVGEEKKGALRWDWIGKVDEEEQTAGGDAASVHDETQRLQTYLTDKETGEQFMVLGNLSLTGDRLEVSCVSDRRLQSCKALVVEKVLGRLVVGRSSDRYQEPASVQGKETVREEGEDEEIPPEVKRKITGDFFEKYYEKWMHTKVPALGNVTPVEASKTEDGRKKLEEILRVAENESERSGGTLKPPTANLRKELGLQPR